MPFLIRTPWPLRFASCTVAFSIAILSIIIPFIKAPLYPRGVWWLKRRWRIQKASRPDNSFYKPTESAAHASLPAFADHGLNMPHKLSGLLALMGNTRLSSVGL